MAKPYDRMESLGRSKEKALNIFERTLIEKCATEHGWENILVSNDNNIIAASARHRVQTTITQPHSMQWLVTFDKHLLIKELLRDFKQSDDTLAISVDSLEELTGLLHRAAELAFALPNQAVDTFHDRVKNELGSILSTATEVERLVKQRVGQNTFREALMDYWGGACAITGIAIPEVLRASHAKPWAKCVSDEERL